MYFNPCRFLALHFEVTNKCNLRCKHCYNIDYLNSNKNDLTTEEAKMVIKKSIDLGCKDIGFSGGEPFMRDDIIELIEFSKDYPIHILTNALLINDDTIKKINNIKNVLIEFRVSLDGLKSHYLLRNIDYNLVLDKIKKLLLNGYVVTVNTMITDNNIDELLEMYKIFKNIGVDRWRLDFIFNSGNAQKNELLFNNKEKMFSVIKRLIKQYIKEKPEMILDINKLFRSAFLDGFESFSYNLNSKPCDYQGSLTIRPNGDISFCPSMNIVYGNILQDDITKIIKGDSWNKFASIRVRDLDKKCHKCKYLKYCGGGCRADGYYDTGNLFGISNFTCDLMKFYVEKVIPLIEKNKIN